MNKPHFSPNYISLMTACRSDLCVPQIFATEALKKKRSVYKGLWASELIFDLKRWNLLLSFLIEIFQSDRVG